MKKFRFSLSSVMTVRSIKELRTRELFSMAVAERVRAEEGLQRALTDLRDLEQLVLERRRAQVLVSEQIAFSREHMLRIQRVREAEAALAKAVASMEAARERWIESRRDLKLLENLETKARSEYRIESDREAQAIMDDRNCAVAGRVPLLES